MTPKPELNFTPNNNTDEDYIIIILWTTTHFLLSDFVRSYLDLHSTPKWSNNCELSMFAISYVFSNIFILINHFLLITILRDFLRNIITNLLILCETATTETKKFAEMTRHLKLNTPKHGRVIGSRTIPVSVARHTESRNPLQNK